MEPKTVRRALGAESHARHIAPEDARNALPAGMVVLTLDGALPVEFLNEGDRVISRNSGVATLVRVTRYRRTIPTIAIKHGTLGVSRPERDAIVPSSQEIHVRDWRAATLSRADQALVPAIRLVDGEFVRNAGKMTLDLFELHFDAPQIIYADGLELASATRVTVPA